MQKEPSQNRGKSLIAIRTNQHQQRKMQGFKSQLPRSFSTPQDNDSRDKQSKSNVARSLSSPEKELSNQTQFLRTRSQGSTSDLDFENFEQFEESLLDIDADNISLNQYRRSPDIDEPKRVLTSLLPGAGLHRITMRPISSSLIDAQSSKLMKNKKAAPRVSRSGMNIRPLSLKMPVHQMHFSEPAAATDTDELQTSPQHELETLQLEKELTEAEQQLNKGVAIAKEESDAEADVLGNLFVSEGGQRHNYHDVSNRSSKTRR